MTENEVELDINEKIYEELTRICRGVEGLEFDLSYVSNCSHDAKQDVTILKVHSMLLSNAIACLEEIQQYREDRGLTSFRASEDVLKHQIASLSDTYSLFEKTFTRIDRNLHKFEIMNDRLGKTIKLLVNDNTVRVLSAKTRLNNKQKKEKLHKLAQTERETYKVPRH